jgi:hypothetical protein
MSSERQQPADYFASPARWLWEWRDDGDVISWADGTTITFRAEMLDLLTRLESKGLPRFGSLVLFLAAIRGGWLESKGRTDLLNFVNSDDRVSHWLKLAVEVIDGLDRLHAMRELLDEPAKKSAVAGFIVERVPKRLSLEASSSVVRELRTGLSRGALATSTDGGDQRVLTDLWELYPGLMNLDRESVEQRLTTGLEWTVRPVQQSLPLGLAARRLIQQSLLDDETLSGIARLAMRILAVLQLPRPKLEMEELGIEGISDITNHGSLDRLLLSELVHDDMTLAVRVATNEALYTRREPLSSNQTRQSYVLIDSGLRMWGLPRVFGAAVGLAIAAKADRRTMVQLWRADGPQLFPIDFSTTKGLNDHLAALGRRVHPGESLKTFVRELRATDLPTEAMLITTPSVLEDREFIRELDQCDVETWHIALVERDGDFRLVQRTHRGSKTLCAARIELDEILTSKSKVKAPVRLYDRTSVVLPAIYLVQPFPLRIPVPIDLSNSWYVRQWGTITLSGDGRLFQWNVADQGPAEIATGLPSGEIRWCSSQAEEQGVDLVVGSLSQRGLYAVQLALDRNVQSVHQLKLDSRHPVWVTAYQGVIFVFFPKRINALDPTTGELLDACDCPQAISRHGRFFQRAGSGSSTFWIATAFDGNKIVFPMLTNPSLGVSAVVDVFDYPLYGPVGITAARDLLNSWTEQQIRVKHIEDHAQWEIAGKSRDGSRLLFRKAVNRNDISGIYELVDVRSGHAQLVRGKPEQALEPLARDLAKMPTMRRRAQGIFVDASGHLALVSRKGTIWPIHFNQQLNAIALPKIPSALQPAGEILKFEELQRSATGGRELQIARWPDGSAAILDTLGMLHLRSSDESIPECTIVLSEGRTSGWVADNRFWGSPYFVGHQSTNEAKEIFRQVIEPFVGRIRAASRAKS